MRLVFIRVSLILFAFQTQSYSQELRPITEQYELPDGTMLDSVTTTQGSLPKGTLNIFGFTLGGSTFTHIRSVLGPAQMCLEDGGTDHETSIIGYRSLEDTDVCLILESSSLQSALGEWNLTSFALCRRNALPAAAKKCNCPATPKLPANVGTQSGVKLGLDKAQIIAILGKPSRRTSHWMIYSLQSYGKLTLLERKKLSDLGYQNVKGKYITQDAVCHFSNNELDLIQVSLWIEIDSAG